MRQRTCQAIGRMLVMSATTLGLTLAAVSCEGTNGGSDNDQEVPRMVDVGGHSLSISCFGSGSPTVVLESGLGIAGSVDGGWSVVKNDVKSFARVCLYDRAGLGKSDKGPEPRDSQRIVTELQALLQNAGLRPPYVLAGHSMGGLHIQVFSEQYPEEVVGMVFIDPTVKELAAPIPQEKLDDMAAAGVDPGRLADVRGLNPSVPQVQALGRLLNLPVVVLTSSLAAAMQAGGTVADQWQKMNKAHQALADEVSDGIHIVATTAGHFIQEDEPNLVIDAIRRVWDKVASR